VSTAELATWIKYDYGVPIPTVLLREDELGAFVRRRESGDSYSLCSRFPRAGSAIEEPILDRAKKCTARRRAGAGPLVRSAY
jgi:hypothetical protein